jgi:hypothetical protein
LKKKSFVEGVKSAERFASARRQSEPGGNAHDANRLNLRRTSKPVGDLHHLLVFASQDSANAWFKEFEPEGIAFEYPVIGKEAPRL